jgi:type VI protein secretion system component VasK
LDVVHLLEMQSAKAAPVAGRLAEFVSSRPWRTAWKRLKWSGMKFVLALVFLSLLTACANRPEQPPAMQDRKQAKADAKAREDFAKTLPKPRE